MVKKRNLIFIFFVFLLFSCSNNAEDAIEYNEKIVLSYQKVADIEEKLMFYLLTEDTTNFNKEHKKFLKQVELSEKEIVSIGSFNDNTDFYDAALEMIGVYKEVANKRILDLMMMKKETSKTINESDSLIKANLFEKNLKELDSIMEKEFEKFVTAQEKFAAKLNFKLM